MSASRLLIPVLLLGCCLASCGRENFSCSIDCEDALRPETRQSLWEEKDCESCRQRHAELRAAICGPKPGLACDCVYNCEDNNHFP